MLWELSHALGHVSQTAHGKVHPKLTHNRTPFSLEVM